MELDTGWISFPTYIAFVVLLFVFGLAVVMGKL